MSKQIPAINSDLTSTVDDWAYDFLIKYKWYVDSEGYFACYNHGICGVNRFVVSECLGLLLT